MSRWMVEALDNELCKMYIAFTDDVAAACLPSLTKLIKISSCRNQNLPKHNNKKIQL